MLRTYSFCRIITFGATEMIDRSESVVPFEEENRGQKRRRAERCREAER